MPNTPALDRSILEAALEGLQRRLEEINGKIGEVRRLLRAGQREQAAPAPAAPARKKRRMSAAARRRIAEAQKRRWAQFRAARKAG